MRILPFKIQISKIENNLYLGSIEDAYDAKKLAGLGITHVLNMATEIPNFYEGQFEYRKINGRDIPAFQMHKHFEEVADFIHQSMQKGKVLVHCFCGISRSTTAILAYYVKYRGMDPRKGCEMIRKKRWIVYPNDGFMRQLVEYFRSKGVDAREPEEKSAPLSTPAIPSRSNFTIKRVDPVKFASVTTVPSGPGRSVGARAVGRSTNKENLYAQPANGKRSVPRTRKLGSDARLNCFKI